MDRIHCPVHFFTSRWVLARLPSINKVKIQSKTDGNDDINQQMGLSFLWNLRSLVRRGSRDNKIRNKS